MLFGLFGLLGVSGGPLTNHDSMVVCMTRDVNPRCSRVMFST